MSRVQAAWLAGLFDGEGSIIRPHAHRTNSVRITINNTCQPLVQQIAQVTGTGNVLYRASKNPKHADQWVWQCYADNARSLLRQMLPWLIVKREKALEAIER